jgi:hypothetical protein
MVPRSVRWSAFALPLLLGAGSATADPLTYSIQAANPVVQVALDGDVSVTYSPLLGPPTTVSLLNGSSTLFGRPRGSAVADAGLPNAFLGGAHGIVVSSFHANTEFGDATFLFTDLFGQLPPIPSPVPLVGAGLLVHIADLELVQGTPVISALHPNGQPNGFSWSGETSPLTVNGSIDVSVLIPGQEPIGLPATATFSVAMSPAPFFGGFTGDATTTTLEVGVDALEVDPDTSTYLAPIEINLGVLGGISVDVTRLRFRIDGAYTGVNKKYGLPPPSATPGCGIGPELALLVPALGFLRGRRRRAS